MNDMSLRRYVSEQHNENKYCKAITKKGGLCVNSSSCLPNRGSCDITSQQYCTIHENQYYDECVVCYEKINIPFKLNCTHTVCHDCIIKWCNKCNDRNLICSCPVCRRDCSTEWLAYANVIAKHRKRVMNMCMKGKKFPEHNKPMTGVPPRDTWALKLFELILNKPSHLAGSHETYNLLRSHIIRFFKKSTTYDIDTSKVGKMFKAFNEKYYDNDRKTLKT